MQAMMLSKDGIRVWLGVGVLLIGSVACPWLAEARTGSEVTAGVVVEALGEGSAPEKAGLLAEDVLISWERLPNPPANPQGARGRIDSVFDWMWVKSEQAPRSNVKLAVLRGGEDKVIEVARGEWKLTLRARMPKAMLEDYARGRDLIHAGELEKGIDLWHEAVTAAEGQNTDWSVRCWLLLRIGDALGKTRQWEKADSIYRRALETSRDPRSRVLVWWAIGTLAEKRADLDRAAESYERSLEIAQKLAPGGLYVAKILYRLAGLAFARGHLDRMAELGEEALGIRQELAPGSLDLAWSLNASGLLAAERGDHDQAVENYEKALEIQQKLAPGSLAVSASLNNLGLVNLARVDLERASEYFEEALEIHQKWAPGSLGVAGRLANLGLVAAGRGDTDRAVEYYEEVLEIFQELAPGSLGMAKILNNLGYRATVRGDWDQAAEYYDASLEIRLKLAPGSLDVANSLGNLGHLATQRGEWDQAVGYFEKALEICQKLAPGSSRVSDSLRSLGNLHRNKNQLRSALSLFYEALRILEDQIGKLGGSRGRQSSFRAFWAGAYHDTIRVSLELGKLEEAFHTLERFRAQSFLAQFAERDLLYSDVPEELDRQRRRSARRYDQAQTKIAQLDPKNQAQEIEALQDQLQKLRWEYGDIKEKILKEAPRLGALRYPQPLGFTGAQKALDRGTVMLSYSVSENNTDIFILASDGDLRVRTLDLGDKDLRRQVRRWNELIPIARSGDESGALYSVRSIGKRLYRQLIEPAADAVAGSRRLLISPDGPLHALPWGALIRETETDGETYLAQWKPLHVVLSATVYAQLKKRRSRSRNDLKPASIRLAAFGDPLFPGSAEYRGDFRVRSAIDRGLFDGWESLPHTRREIERIAALYPSEATRIYLGAEATEEAVKAVVRRQPFGSAAQTEGGMDVLHFATHGHLDNRSPLDSAVVLTIPKESGNGLDNGLLQVWEIFEGVRFDADLVVLSACASALGEEQVGEGLIGLTRAFQYAGARSVVASLWNVQDQATSELMVRFYRYLNEGLAKDEALRAAQSELIRGEIEVEGEDGKVRVRDYSAPYYWAPFQVYGDWQ